ncbi:MAG: preprotein translocase subunit SecG, partial [Phycisphaerae bacterium]|nr:preprotein translocase subunit SecG [Phycisphaerae bacterium]
MTICPILAVGFIMKAVAVLWFLSALVLILIILIQKGRGGGLSGAFGGGGMASSVLGTKTGDFLTWATICLVGLFFVLLIVMARFYHPSVGQYA